MQNDSGRRIVTIRGADEVGAMFGGLDIAEAIRLGTLDSLKNSDHEPHIAGHSTAEIYAANQCAAFRAAVSQMAQSVPLGPMMLRQADRKCLSHDTTDGQKQRR